MEWVVGEVRRQHPEEKDQTNGERPGQVKPIVRSVRQRHQTNEPNEHAGNNRHLDERKREAPKCLRLLDLELDCLVRKETRHGLPL